MSQTPKLELRQSQSLVMTAQLQQSIKLLQMSSLELAEYIEQELEKNPLLTTEDEVPGPVSEGEEAADRLPLFEGEEGASSPAEDAMPEEGRDTPLDDHSDEDWGAAAGEGRYTSSRAADYDGEEGGFEQTLSGEVSLRDHLLDQLQMDVTDPAKRLIGRHLIDLVNDDGYITEDLAPLTELLVCEMADIEEAIKRLQRFDPPGVCARNLAECLAIQLRERDRLDPAMQKLLDNLPLLGKGDIEGLRKICGVDKEDMTEMCAEIRALNPRPGASFSHEVAHTAIPDIFVRRMKDGWQVELNSEQLPRVLINRRYYSQLAGHTHRRKEDKKYLSDQIASANWLIKALDQRAQTMLKVGTEIVKQQDAFFRHGIRYLKPLTLKDVAMAIEMHESTVSRVTTSKFMATPRGLYELKYFFTSSLQSAHGGDDLSSRTVQHMIQELIDAESPGEILSDDTLADLLKEKGVDVARRTVAKYREALRIPSSVERRRVKKQG